MIRNRRSPSSSFSSSVTAQVFGPWAVVTGASQGLGRGFAERLAAAGLHLVLVARSADRLEELGRRLSQAHRIEHRVVPLDLSHPGAGAALARATADLDVGLVVSNAGGGRPGALLGRDLEELHSTVRLNGLSQLDVAHAFAPRLVRRGRGGLLLVSSMGGLHGLPFMATDSAAKAFATNLGEALHHELAGTGVRVTTLLPGGVDTPVVDAFALDRTEMPLRLVPVEVAVREALSALARNRVTLVPGRSFRIMQRLTPRAVSIRVNARMLRRAAERLDAREPRTAP